MCNWQNVGHELEDPKISFVKRVIAVPGDKVEIRQKRVFINDQILKHEPVSPSDSQLKGADFFGDSLNQ